MLSWLEVTVVDPAFRDLESVVGPRLLHASVVPGPAAWDPASSFTRTAKGTPGKAGEHNALANLATFLQNIGKT